MWEAAVAAKAGTIIGGHVVALGPFFIMIGMEMVHRAFLYW